MPSPVAFGQHSQAEGGSISSRHVFIKTKVSSRIILILCAAAGFLFSLQAFADEYHYNNILIGDRAAGMGGAYTAISDDPSGLFYNPAGIAYVQGSNVSVSANAFHQTKTVYKSALGGADYERNSSALLPNFFGIIQPLGKGRVGFSYAVPDSILEDQNQVFYNVNATTQRYAINFNNNDNTYNVGPSYAIELTNEFSFGITLYGHYRQNEWISNQLTNKSAGYEWLNAFYKSTEFGVKPIVGLMWSPTSKVSAGLTVNKINILSANTVFQAVCTGDTAISACQGLDPTYAGGAPLRLVNTSDIKKVYPLTSTLGVAYFPTKSLIFSGDFSYYGKVSDNTFGDREATWNIALGTEYYFNETWALRAGVFTDRANTPKIKSSDVNALDHVDLYGGSLSVAYFTRQSSITVGSSFRYGTGQAQILGNNLIQDVQAQAMTLFLSAAYFY